MDDKTIFDTDKDQSQVTPVGTNSPSGGRISTQDLYGPSTDIKQEPQIQQPIIEPPSINPVEPMSIIQPSELVQENQTEGFSGNTQSPPSNRFVSFFGNKKLVIGAIIGAVIFFIIVIGLISRIVGGGGGGKSSNASLIYWGLWEENKTMQIIIKDFEKKNPGIKIKYEKQDPQKYKERLLTRVKNNTEAPDIFTFHNTWVPTLTSSSDNILLPLSKDVVTPEEFKASYYPVIQRDLTKNGAIYGLPQGIDTLALYINTDIFTAAGIKIPQTWEEFNMAAKELTVKDADKEIKTSGVALGTYDNVTHAPDIVSLLMATNGVDLNQIDKQREYLKEALVIYSSFAQGDDAVWNNNLIGSRDMFAAGNLAMYFGYSWDFFVINSMNKDLKFQIHQVPYLPTGNNTQNRLTIASYWANGVSLQGKHQKEALLFLKYLSQKETLQMIFTEASKTRVFGMPYPRRDMADSLSDNPSVFPFIQQAEYATSSIFSSDTHDSLYNGVLNDYLGNTIRQQGSANGSIDSAIDTLIQGVNQAQSSILR